MKNLRKSENSFLESPKILGKNLLGLKNIIIFFKGNPRHFLKPRKKTLAHK